MSVIKSNKGRKLLLTYMLDEIDDEDMLEMLCLPRFPKHPIFKRRMDKGYFKLLITNHLCGDERNFLEFFRLSKPQFEFVLSLIEEDIKKMSTNCNPYPITSEEKLGLTLRFLATGESYHSLQFQFRISVSEISCIVKETLTVLKKKLTPLFVPHLSTKDLENKAKEYYERWNFPNCVGAIDGKQIRVRCPDKSASLYYNFKGFFSIVLLAVVDANCKFIYTDVGSFGKEGDSGIFEKSTLGRKFYSGTLLPPPKQLPNSDLILPYVFVGDEAFRLHPNMMKPYQREDAIGNNNKSVFNYRLCRARRTSENAFGILAQVFRIFYTPININPRSVDDVIVVCCCLHNMLREGYLSKRGRANYEVDLTQDLPTNNLISLRRTGGYANVEGFTVRNMYASYFANEGSVNWQDDIVYRTDTAK